MFYNIEIIQSKVKPTVANTVTIEEGDAFIINLCRGAAADIKNENDSVYAYVPILILMIVCNIKLFEKMALIIAVSGFLIRSKSLLSRFYSSLIILCECSCTNKC